jgi:hypothetical protein
MISSILKKLLRLLRPKLFSIELTIVKKTPILIFSLLFISEVKLSSS